MTYGHLVFRKIFCCVLGAVDSSRVVFRLLLEAERELLHSIDEALGSVDLLVGSNAVEVNHCDDVGSNWPNSSELVR